MKSKLAKAFLVLAMLAVPVIATAQQQPQYCDDSCQALRELVRQQAIANELAQRQLQQQRDWQVQQQNAAQEQWRIEQQRRSDETMRRGADQQHKSYCTATQNRGYGCP